MTIIEHIKHRADIMWDWCLNPPNLKRWKVGLSVGCVAALFAGLYNQTNSQNEAVIHEIRCTQAHDQDKLHEVLFEITSLSLVFGNSTEIDLYEKAMHAIIDNKVVQIVVNNCPKEQA